MSGQAALRALARILGEPQVGLRVSCLVRVPGISPVEQFRGDARRGLREAPFIEPTSLVQRRGTVCSVECVDGHVLEFHVELDFDPRYDKQQQHEWYDYGYQGLEMHARTGCGGQVIPTRVRCSGADWATRMVRLEEP